MNPQIQDSVINTEKIIPQGFWESLGFGKIFGKIVEGIFGYSNLSESLTLANIVITSLFIFAILTLIGFLYKIFSYTKKEPMLNKLELIPLIMDKNQYDFFEKFCERDENGTYKCSYTLHNKYRKYSRLGLHGAIYAGSFKVIILMLLFIVNTGYLKAFEGRSGTNYTIFIDSALAGGGALASATYAMDSSFGEPIASSPDYSNSYISHSGISNILDEPYVSFTADTTPLSFGVASSAATDYASHTFTASYNGSSGYDIYIYGYPPTNESNYPLQVIGSTATSPNVGTEQFGLNLRGNTVPAVVGADPTGGAGEAYGQYAITNNFAFNQGDIIARSTTASTTTTFTSTVIVNISQLTPAGSYAGLLLYSMVPKY